MKVLYISYDGLTDPLGQSQIIPYLTGLSKNNYQITIISCEKHKIYNKQNKMIRELLGNTGIGWIPVFYSSIPSLLSKPLNLFLMKQKAMRFYKKNKPGIVHCRSYMAALIGLQLKKKYGIKFIFDMRGLWADERIDGGIWKLSNPLHKYIYRYFKKKEIEFLSAADYTISLTQKAKNEIYGWKSFQNAIIPIQVIPCCVDLQLFSRAAISPDQLQTAKNKLNIQPGEFILSYLGSIGTWYMLDEMLDFFKNLLAKKKNARFLLVTPDEKNIILSKAEARGIPGEKIIIQPAYRNEVPVYLSLSSISIYFIKPVYSKMASSATKTAEIMALGIPIITNTGIGDSDQIISDSGSGVLITTFTNDEYNRIINQIDVLLKKNTEEIRAVSQHYFSLERGIGLYLEVYKNVMQH